MTENHKIIAIVGPTASGKTRLSVKLAKKYNGEIISADSRQIYAEMNIGTAKPNKIEMSSVKHHLIGHVKPNADYNVADYQKAANRLISKIVTRNKVPFLVGGTGLYVSSVIHGYNLPAAKPDPKLRSQLEKKSAGQLFLMLNKLAPRTCKLIDKKNKRHLIRSIEIARATGQEPANLKTTSMPYDVLQIGIDMPRDVLFQMINKRVDMMINDGLINEVKFLVNKYGPHIRSLSGIGYSQVILYLNNKINKERAIELIKRDTRHYAKRQLTWFRRDKTINWVKNFRQAEALIKKFY